MRASPGGGRDGGTRPSWAERAPSHPEAAEHAAQTLACILLDRTRRMDLCARFSAGRFIVVLLDCPLEQAERFARDIEDRFNASEFPWSKTRIRVGSAAIKDGMGSPDVLIATADRALHRAGQVGPRPPPGR
ncbi:MAG: diguanylate cyclase [Gemmatimonadota bacterium]|nr:diguanylate cyclase [Gemmatimonadota bacterium]